MTPNVREITSLKQVDTQNNYISRNGPLKLN